MFCLHPSLQLGDEGSRCYRHADSNLNPSDESGREKRGCFCVGVLGLCRKYGVDGSRISTLSCCLGRRGVSWRSQPDRCWRVENNKQRLSHRTPMTDATDSVVSCGGGFVRPRFRYGSRSLPDEVRQHRLRRALEWWFHRVKLVRICVRRFSSTEGGPCRWLAMAQQMPRVL